MPELVGYRGLIVALWAVIVVWFGVDALIVAHYDGAPYIVPLIVPLLLPGVPIVLLTRRYWNA